jgi:hypothetical protein
MSFILAHILDYVGGIASDTTLLRIVSPSIDIAVSGAIECESIVRESDTVGQLLELIDVHFGRFYNHIVTKLTSLLLTTVWVGPLCRTQAPFPVSCSLLMPYPCSTTKSPPSASNCKLRGRRKLFATTETWNPGATEGAPCAGAMGLGQAAAAELDWALAVSTTEASPNHKCFSGILTAEKTESNWMYAGIGCDVRVCAYAYAQVPMRIRVVRSRRSGMQ